MLNALRVLTIMLVAAIVPLASAQAGEMDKPLAARKAVMKLNGFYMGQLGAMAKSKIAYDAKTAQGAADALLALARLDTSKMWPPGSGTDKLGDITRAKPDIWAANSDVGAKAKALETALEDLVKVAGGGLGSLQGSIGAVGKTCGGCHKPFRVKKKK